MQQSLNDTEQFKEWLDKGGHAKGKVINDIASRARRVANMVNILDKQDLEMLVVRLDKNSDFSKLSPSVKSQLKKSLRLYREFKGIK